MKNRAETKKSIFDKSKVIIEQRNRYRKAWKQTGVTLAACFAVGFIVFAVSLRNIGIFDKNDDSAIKLQTAPTDAYCYGENDGYKFAGGVQDLPRLDKAVMGNSDEYALPDSINIVSSSSKKFVLSSDESSEAKIITELCDLLVKLDMTKSSKNNEVDNYDYLIEANYDCYKVTFCLSDRTIKINNGDLMKISVEQSEELYNFLEKLNR